MSFLDTNTDINNFQESVSGGGIDIFNHVGNTTGNITLIKNKITTAHFTGNHTITLPTVSSTKQETCILDFTTVNTSYPSITNTNIKYSNGLIPQFQSTTFTLPTILGASNTTPIEIISNSHGCKNGDTITISSVGGNTAANGTWVITKTGVNGFTLNDSSGNGIYTSGGTAKQYICRNRLIFNSILGVDGWELKNDSFCSYRLFNRPNLTSNGVMGGASFAVRASHELPGGEFIYSAYRAFDSNLIGSGWNSDQINVTLDFYNPDPIKVSHLNYFCCSTTYCPRAGKIQASNNDSSWVDLATFTNSSQTLSIDIPTDVQDLYKYYRLLITSKGSSGYTEIENVDITATLI